MSPAEYSWAIAHASIITFAHTTNHTTQCFFQEPGFYINVTITPSVGEIQHIHELIVTYMDFNIGNLGAMEIDLGIRMSIFLHGNFPSTGMQFTWHVPKLWTAPVLTSSPKLALLFDVVGVFEIRVNASNNFKYAVSNGSITVHDRLRGMSFFSIYCVLYFHRLQLIVL